jgi:hypothetical protein
MKKMRLLKNSIIEVNLLPCILFAFICCITSFVISCEVETGNECDLCNGDKYCKEGMTCKEFQTSLGGTVTLCAKPTTTFCN